MNHRTLTPASSPRTPFTRRARGLALAGALAGGFAVTPTSAADATPEELLARAAELIRQAEAQQAAESAARETKSDALDRVLADSEKRSTVVIPKSSYLQSDDGDTFRAGHRSGRFLLQSDDGAFTLSPNVQLQVRHVANFAPVDNSIIPDDDLSLFDDVDFGWELTRTKVGITGNAFSRDLKYDFKVAFPRNENGVSLQNAFVEYTPATGLFGNENLGFRIGQFKDPTFFSEATSSTRLMAVDRQLANEVLGGGQTFFVQGIGLVYSGERAQLFASYVDGLSSLNTPFLDGADNYEFGLTARADFLVLGDSFSEFREFTAVSTQSNAARVGGGVFVQFADDGDDRLTAVLFTIDGSYKTAGGLGLFAAYYGNFIDDGAGDFFNNGVELLVSQAIDRERGLEVFAGYSAVLLDEEDASGEDLYHEFVAGFNKYFEGHAVKATVDVAWLINGQPAAPVGTANTIIGYRRVENANNNEGQVAIRGQFQLLL